jgi:predicted RNA-binding Zn-ribbon protein involved in translation (DUF1610 family)/DNA polymerase elongation subunit (family B)
MTKKPKILLFDIETAPNLSYVWGHYEQNVIEHSREWYVLCFVAKWMGNRKMITEALPDYKAYKKDPEDDKEVVTALWHLLDEADIVVAHNGDRFDIRKMNARFIFHGLKPPAPYKTVDTLKVARKYFAFNSNKLNDIGQHLGLGKKVSTGGFELWKGCMQGDKKSWAKMIKYNKQDVNLLEKVYIELRSWMTNHPSMGAYIEDNVCPNCGSEHLQKRGTSVTRVSKYQRYQCQDCGAWGKGKPQKIEGVEVR